MDGHPLRADIKETIAQLYKDNKGQLTAWLINKGCSKIDANEIYHQAILAVAERVSRSGMEYFKNGPKTYLFSVAKYLFYDHVKNKKLIVSDEIPEYVHADMQDFLNEPDERAVFLRQKLDNLDAKSYKIIKLYYYEGKNMKEIAELLGFGNEKVAKSSKYRVIQKLKGLMTFVIWFLLIHDIINLLH